MSRDEMIRLVVSRAISGDETLTAERRVALYKGLSLLLPEDEGEALRAAAFFLMEAESARLRLHQLFDRDEDPDTTTP